MNMNMNHESCMDNISKIMKILISLGFLIHPSKSKFIPPKTIEYLIFVINTEDMAIRLSYSKKMVVFTSF